MIRAALALTLLAATPALAETSAYVGHWGTDAAHCAVAGTLAEDRPVELLETELFAHEWSCEFITLELLPGRAWKSAHTCLDMGFVEKFDELWVIDANDRLNIFAETGEHTTLQRCEVAQ